MLVTMIHINHALVSGTHCVCGTAWLPDAPPLRTAWSTPAWCHAVMLWWLAIRSQVTSIICSRHGCTSSGGTSLRQQRHTVS